MTDNLPAPTSYIHLGGEHRAVITCGTTGIPVLDTCVDNAVVQDINGIGIILLTVIAIAFVLKKASMAG